MQDENELTFDLIWGYCHFQSTALQISDDLEKRTNISWFYNAELKNIKFITQIFFTK